MGTSVAQPPVEEATLRCRFKTLTCLLLFHCSELSSTRTAYLLEELSALRFAAYSALSPCSTSLVTFNAGAP